MGLAAWAVAAAGGLAAGTDPLNLFLTLGRHRRLFRGWLGFARRLMPGGRLPRRETEMVILRVAKVRGCDYELGHHRRLARRAGLPPGEIDRLAGDPVAGDWSGRDAAILSATDALVLRRDLDDAEWANLRAHLGEVEAIELCMLAGHYDMLATTIAALRIEPEGPAHGRAARLAGRFRPRN